MCFLLTANSCLLGSFLIFIYFENCEFSRRIKSAGRYSVLFGKVFTTKANSI